MALTPPASLWTRTTTAALLLGAVHLVVDLASGYLIFFDAYRAPVPRETLVAFALLYNGIAFGGQAPLGAVVDRIGAYRRTAVAGVLLAALALGLARWALLPAIATMGLGNAAFHVGAGAHVLGISGERSRESGVFVGPGAIGITTGCWLGAQRVEIRWVLVATLALGACLAARAMRSSGAEPRAPLLPSARLAGWVTLTVLGGACLLGSVAVRSLVGGGLSGAWRGVSTDVVLALGLGACAGKMLGGFAGDRWGWIGTTVAALLVSAPLVSWLAIYPVGAIVGMLVFQMTMPVTLKAIHHLMPSRPGLAFGIPCAALLIGALPGLTGVKLLRGWEPAFGSVLFSAVLVTLGLWLASRAGASLGPKGTSPRT